jgi:DNA-binding sugar fermentation-stimulating protein
MGNDVVNTYMIRKKNKKVEQIRIDFLLKERFSLLL